VKRCVAFIFILFSLLAVPSAQADYLDYTFVDNPEFFVLLDDGNYIDVRPVCAQMKYSYLQEMKSLKEMKAQMDLAVQQPLTSELLSYIDDLKKGIHERTERLIFLAKPEWNTESFYYVIRWWLGEEFSTANRKITSYEIKAAYYKGEFAGSLAPNLIRNSIEVPGYKVPKAKKNWRHFDFYSRGTYLELCQFAPTLEFEVQTGFYFVDLPGLRQLSHMFFLKGRVP